MKNIISIYGVHTVENLIRLRPEQIKKLLVQTGQAEKRLALLISEAEKNGIIVERVDRSQLDQLSGVKIHQGIIALCSELLALDDSALKSLLSTTTEMPILLLILDRIQDPHNLGACLRTANAMGVQAVIAPKDHSVDLTPTVRKVAGGAELHTPFVRVTNLARTLRWLKEQGIWIVGTVLEAEIPLREIDLSVSTALVLGNEGEGLRRLTQECCDYLAYIPMYGSVQSLNISVATGICLYEVNRQRKYLK